MLETSPVGFADVLQIIGFAEPVKSLLGALPSDHGPCRTQLPAIQQQRLPQVEGYCGDGRRGFWQFYSQSWLKLVERKAANVNSTR